MLTPVIDSNEHMQVPSSSIPVVRNAIMNQQNQNPPQPYILIGVSNETPPELPQDRPLDQPLDAHQGYLWLRIPIPQSRIEEEVSSLPVSDIIDGPDETEPNSPESAVAAEVPPSIRIIEPTACRQVFPLNPETGQTAITRINPDDVNETNPDEDWFRFAATRGQLLFVSADSDRWQSTKSPQPSFKLSLVVKKMGDTRYLQWSDNAENQPIALYEIPEDGDYMIRIAAADGRHQGPYRLYVQLLPATTRWWKWMSPAPYGGNAIHQIQLFDSASKICVAQFYNYLTLLDPQNPEFRFALSGRASWRFCETVALGIGSGSFPAATNPVILDEVLFLGGGSFVSASRKSDIVVNVRTYDSTDEIWTWSHGDWQQVSKRTDWPERRSYSTLVYDAANREYVLFGGTVPDTNPEPGVFANDTWIHNSGHWRKWSPASNDASAVPIPRGHASAAFDDHRGRVVLFGGYHTDYPYWFQDMWEWDGDAWKQRSISEDFRGMALLRTAMAYDAERKVLVLISQTQGTWEFHQTPGTDVWKWILVRDAVHDPFHDRDGNVRETGHYFHRCMCYDQDRREILLVLDFDSPARVRETWAWKVDGGGQGDWTLRKITGRDSQESTHAVIPAEWSPGHQAPVMFIGRQVPGNNSPLPLMMRYWNGSIWLNVETSSAPANRHGVAIAWNPELKEFLLAGGSFSDRNYHTRVLEVRKGFSSDTVHSDEYCGPRQQLRGLATAPDGTHFATVTLTNDRWMLHLHLTDGTLISEVEWHATADPANCADLLRLSDDGRFALLFRTHGSSGLSPNGAFACVYDFQGQCFTLAQADSKSAVEIVYQQTLSMSHDGRTVAAGDVKCTGSGFYDMVVWKWDENQHRHLEKCRVRARQTPENPSSNCALPFIATLSGDGSRLFAAIRERVPADPDPWSAEFAMWDTSNGSSIWRKPIPANATPRLSSRLVRLAMNEDGSLAAVARCQADRAASDLIVLDAATGEIIFEFQTPGNCTALDLAGRRVALAVCCERSGGRGRGVALVFDV